MQTLREPIIDFLPQFGLLVNFQRLLREGTHVSNVTRVSLKQLNKVTLLRKDLRSWFNLVILLNNYV